MQQLTGKTVSPGYAEGKAFVYSPRRLDEFARYTITASDIPGEHRRFHDAVERSFRELKQLENRALNELGKAQSAIFASHLGLLQDEQFIKRVKARVEHDLINVEHALDLEVAGLCAMLASVDSEYIRERAQDVRDVGARVMRQFAPNDGGHYVDLPPQSVIVAHELLPSETFDLDREHVVAIVSEEGGENSHAAILARALGIPAVTGIASATSSIKTGETVLVDGEAGVISVEPSDTAFTDFTIHKSHYDGDTSAAVAAESLECVTRDGTRVELLANINRPHESPLVGEHHLEGVGLFRSEFMFLDSVEPPSFERQVTAYRRVIETLGSRPFVIRTLDLGGDKIPAFLAPHHEANPNLGSRGLRFSLAERTLFETQLRAIITAARGHENVRLLLPMVLGAGDLKEAVELVRSLSRELDGAASPEVGAMIETPAALFALNEIFEIADFACIGTNDLTQFMLAADRNAIELADDYSVLHPSVLRAIAMVVDAGRSANRDVCVCGEAASYPKTACLLVGLGARQLSMSPVRAARVRFLLRSMHLSWLEELAKRALESTSAGETRRDLQESFARTAPRH